MSSTHKQQKLIKAVENIHAPHTRSGATNFACLMRIYRKQGDVTKTKEQNCRPENTRTPDAARNATFRPRQLSTWRFIKGSTDAQSRRMQLRSLGATSTEARFLWKGTTECAVNKEVCRHVGM